MRTTRAATAALSLLLLTTIAPTPARAAEPPGTMSFTGTVTVNPALGLWMLSPMRDGTWSLSGGGAGSTVDGAGGATINVSGEFYDSTCGHMTAALGTGLLTIGPWEYQLTAVGWPATHGYTYRFTGTSNGTATVDGVMTWMPPNAAAGVGSCPSGTAVAFHVSGSATVTG